MTSHSPTTREHAVVTGGAGFLGSHLVDSLLEAGYRVTSLDNFGSGSPRNLSHLTDDDRFTSIDHDVRAPFPEFESVEYIFHFASRASPEDFDSHPVEIALTNSVGSNNAFKCAREYDATVILASTSEVYGNPQVHPQHEGYYGNVNPRGPRAPYDESKRFAESLGVAYETWFDIDVRTVRVFNTYGPRMRADDGRVVPTFVRQALEGDDLTIYGDGTQTRSFCYVSNLVEGIRLVADTPSVSGEAINLGSEREITIRRLAEIITDHVDTPTGVVHESRPEDDPDVRQPRIDKARRELGWEPTTELEDGIQRTIDYFEGIDLVR